jgi:hypothetical protein
VSTRVFGKDGSCTFVSGDAGMGKTALMRYMAGVAMEVRRPARSASGIACRSTCAEGNARAHGRGHLRHFQPALQVRAALGPAARPPPRDWSGCAACGT